MVFKVVLKLFRTTKLNIDLKTLDIRSDGFISGEDLGGNFIIIKDWIMVYEVKEDVKA